jgi:putative nucleotidyltransferase with HDIG domain
MKNAWAVGDVDLRQYVTPDQLCVGLYIHLDLRWTEHPFTFSSFKIKSAEQIAALRALSLARIRYSADKSDCLPAASTDTDADTRPRATTTSPVTPEGEASAAALSGAADMTAAQTAKAVHGGGPANAEAVSPTVIGTAEHLRRIALQHAKAEACQQELAAAAKAMRAIGQKVLTRPTEAREAATELVRQVAASMLVDADVSIRLMADKVGGEDVYFHALNVSLLSMMLAKELNASVSVVHTTGLGALFHDVGDAEIPTRILRHTEPLTRAETALLHMHSEYGVNLGDKAELPADVRQVILQHHEKVDGSGYPKASRPRTCHCPRAWSRWSTPMTSCATRPILPMR